MKKLEKRCGTCRFLRPRDDGKPFHFRHAYPCLWRMPPEYKFPASARGYSLSHTLDRLGKQAIGSYMGPKDGTDCACWEPKASPTGSVGAVAEPEGRSA